jgi:PST family polysaccharide transporter
VNLRTLAAVTVMAGSVFALRRVAHFGEGSMALAERLAVEVVVGAVLYLGGLALMWLALGRPAGPEAEVVRLAGALARRLSRTT